MGTEAEGTLTVGGQTVQVRGDFGSDSVMFSGGRRGKVYYSQIEVLGTGKGKLKLRVDGQPMEFLTGERTERIAAKIRKPPTRLQKLGITAGTRVDVRHVADKGFVAELEAAGVVLEAEEPQYVFLGARSGEDLEGLDEFKQTLPQSGALWIVYPRGKHELREIDVLNAGRGVGLKDVKVVRFSETLTALKFVA